MTDIEPRVVALEQIARSTETMLAEIRADIREIRAAMRSDFRLLLTIYLGGMGAIITTIAGGGFLLVRIAAKVGAL